MTYAAVPTAYAGTTFRSHLEANWAATLDANRIVWQYEPETITLPSGTIYIPDFWLPELGTWIEVKGTGIPRIEKAEELARARTCRCTDTCTCQWPDGELVLVGWASQRSDHTEPGRWPRYGYVNWETPAGPSLYYIVCPGCARAQWITLRRPWRCRACRASLASQTAHRAVDRPLLFVEPTGGKCLTSFAALDGADR